jgi:hypothetical protein
MDRNNNDVGPNNEIRLSRPIRCMKCNYHYCCGKMILKRVIINICIAIYNLQNGAMVKLMLITNQMKIVAMKQCLNMMMTYQMKIMIMRQCLGRKKQFTNDFVQGVGFCT